MSKSKEGFSVDDFKKVLEECECDYFVPCDSSNFVIYDYLTGMFLHYDAPRFRKVKTFSYNIERDVAEVVIKDGVKVVRVHN